MTLFEIITVIVSGGSLIISIWAIIVNKQNSNKNNSVLFHKIKEILEPIYSYEKNNGFAFDARYIDLGDLYDFVLEFDNYHFSKRRVEKIWNKLKTQISAFRKVGVNILCATSNPNKINPRIIESYVYTWENEYSSSEMPKEIKENIKNLREKYTGILLQLQELLKTYSKLCREYIKN
ncbi:MAG TPA: hypothetical protein PK675_03275 [Clostridia bacterium]|nr:hypothetical protein [Clostridia bacterium]